MRTWFITGGTPGGFGMAYADAALETGDRVVLTARRPEQLRAWALRHGERVLVLPLDVTDTAQVRTAVAAAEQHFDGVDVLVNNAGRGWYGSIEGTAEDAVRRTFELNFFALLSVTRAVLPGMRERQRRLRRGDVDTARSNDGHHPIRGCLPRCRLPAGNVTQGLWHPRKMGTSAIARPIPTSVWLRQQRF